MRKPAFACENKGVDQPLAAMQAVQSLGFFAAWIVQSLVLLSEILCF